MPSPPLTLLSLNDDVLREILQILLLDTPRALNRASILRTCSTLHLLGLPHLYRIVDLTGYPTRDTVMTHWKTLFGEGGVLTVEGRNGEVGSFVSELRLGPSPPGGGKDYVLGFKVPRLNLPNCSSLLLDLSFSLDRLFFPPFPLIILQLPLVVLRFRYDPTSSFSIRGPFKDASPLELVGLATKPEPWKRLQRIVFQGMLWHVKMKSGSTLHSRLCCADWGVEVLVVQLDLPNIPGLEEEVVYLFFRVRRRDKETFLRGTERIEFRLCAKAVEEGFRREVEKRRQVGLSEFDRRVASLIVFVDEDGTERRLLEEMEG